ncbi:hypothetical protein F4859DRAFT_79420 [Xylaria cf. heliscus]|nr:hypothetical protein F4859DRAFT_79420 [Xylaria cf. heliscus]
MRRNSPFTVRDRVNIRPAVLIAIYIKVAGLWTIGTRTRTSTFGLAKNFTSGFGSCSSVVYNMLWWVTSLTFGGWCLTRFGKRRNILYEPVIVAPSSFSRR